MLESPSYHAIAAMAVTIAMFIGFARGRYPEEIISLVTIAVIAVGLYFAPLEGTKPTDGLAIAFGGFGHSALITICALMIMGRGLVVTGALEPFARLLESVFRFSPQIGLLTALLLAFFMSMFVNDTPVMVLLIPIIVGIAARGLMASSKILMPVNTAVLLGGMATTIGTSTNILVVSIASDLGIPAFGVFQFTPIVLMAGLVAIPYLWLVMPRMLRDNSVVPDNMRRTFHTRFRAGATSLLAGADLESLKDKLPDGITFHDVPPGPLQPDHRLHISGTHGALEEAARALKGDLAPSWVIDRIHRVSKTKGDDIVAVEMTVTADSRLVTRTLASSGIADLYGVAVLGIHRPNRALGERDMDSEAGDRRIQDGDVLLVMGIEEDLQAFARNDGLLRLEGARELPRRSKAVLAGAIMLGAIATASLGLPWFDGMSYAPIKLPIAISALAGAIAMFVTGCVKFDRVGRALSAKVIVLIAASLAIGRVIDESGAAAWLGQALSLGLAYLPPALILSAIMLFVTILTNFASNATAATIGTPIAYSIAMQLGLPPEPLVLAVLFGCNLSFATPIAYQTNLLIMSEGGYEFGDYIRAGVPLVALMVTVLSVLLVVWYGL
ncbi:TRAP transporter large permease subunit [Porphyrobacter sp. SLTP]|uniref:SLC13 family permease n=1 Tax=Porphyrobacter sp. SLTP TaxID=2683266 RepID=UPI00141347CC|nr:SLC13 family permease [Porphyrobacter sp. SLTP]NBB24618.1 TRAP transporter large permease subunit [Porphyrobacter sp. SLTP]